MAKRRTILGLAFEDDRLCIAEVRSRGTRARLLRSGVLEWPANKGLETPTESAVLLRDFLKEQRISTKTAVVGLPAKWLITKEVSLPPADTEALKGMLRLQAERVFSLDPQDLALDYMGPVSNGSSTKVLLIGTQRRRLDRISTLLQTAGLETMAITSTSLCLRRLDREGQQGLYIGNGWTETWSVRTPLPQLRFDDTPGSSTLDAATLGSQIKRIFLLSETSTDDGPQGISLHTHTSLDESTFSGLSQSLNGQTVLLNGDSWLEQAGFKRESLHTAGPARLAAALPLIPSRQAGLELDFLHSAMTQKTKKPHRRAFFWGTVGILALVLLVAAGWYDARTNLKEIALYQGQLEEMADDVAAAQAVVDRVTYATRWTSRDPQFLLYLKHLTETFPEEGSVWATNLAIAENKKAVVTGQATDERPVLQVLDAIKKQPHFDQVQILYLRDAGRNSNEVSFAFSFRCREAR